jgi:hypothetical protein
MMDAKIWLCDMYMDYLRSLKLKVFSEPNLMIIYELSLMNSDLTRFRANDSQERFRGSIGRHESFMPRLNYIRIGGNLLEAESELIRKEFVVENKVIVDGCAINVKKTVYIFVLIKFRGIPIEDKFTEWLNDWSEEADKK